MRKFVNISEVKKKIPIILGERVVSLKSLNGGLVNQNLIASTAGGNSYVVKVYRKTMDKNTIGRIERVLMQLEVKGIPVPHIVADCSINGHQAVVYPYIEGHALPRRDLSLADVHLLGTTLGKIHAALDSVDWDVPMPKRAVYFPDYRGFLRKIDQVEQIVKKKKRRYAAPVFPVLNDLRNCAMEYPWRCKPTPPQLRPKLGHDDFHADNILVRNNKVAAILDWEKMGWTMRGFEVMRSIVFCCRGKDWLLDWKKVKTFVRGYKKSVRLTKLEAKFAFETCLQRMVFSAWAVEEYLKGRVELIKNARRRMIFIKDALNHRKEYSRRIEKLLY